MPLCWLSPACCRAYVMTECISMSCIHGDWSVIHSRQPASTVSGFSTGPTTVIALAKSYGACAERAKAHLNKGNGADRTSEETGSRGIRRVFDIFSRRAATEAAE